MRETLLKNRPMGACSRRQFLRSSAVLCAGAAFAGSRAFGAGSDSNGFESLFNGKDLTGWHKPAERQTHGTGGRWTVVEGVLEGEQDPPGSGNGGILLSDRKFGDFELRFEFKPAWGTDSGVFFRCTERGFGFQYYVDYYDTGNIGHLRGEMPGNFAMKPWQIISTGMENGKPTGFTSKVDPRAEKWPKGVYEQSCSPEEWMRAFRRDDWNVGRIRCVGKEPVITTWLNDLQICQWNGAKCTLPDYDQKRVTELLGYSGAIGLQVHGGKGRWPRGAKCRWRKIQIKSTN